MISLDIFSVRVIQSKVSNCDYFIEKVMYISFCSETKIISIVVLLGYWKFSFFLRKRLWNNWVERFFWRDLGCIYLLYTCKYCDNTCKYCGDTHLQVNTFFKYILAQYSWVLWQYILIVLSQYLRVLRRWIHP